MSNTDSWFKVSDFLYSGISQKIKFYQDFPRFATPKNMEDLKEAIKIYSEQCVVSSKFLRDDYQNLCQSLQQEPVEDEYDLEI
ncbi:hypothetical protein [Desulfitobacterium chlororespirans]|uniref:Uncharacterized protein n=1 Tax=Desulfitobacterium chlororespirans DSM 11544 TaxID=1121395 RepID=A0A1M7UY36_9FIRM|nr:hypothetical protein [Desulfitobacterium chlororespirans]SHN87951.1 hypothetical protein SAMN02745215_05047 [Desulfitobacterium chlororespirans DSM 11544]